ncbi:hypothetical protein O3G_MSEX009695 [Manduca sexta]|uniref:Odorant receptor n=2 Tax=Manduca sexta TaxID=7130 RepID=A0A921ZEC6_MANSE|nr:hypothetical protein O3G_MSEX009695 [Manduca sexta]
MGIFVQNVNRSLRFCLTMLKLTGFLVPNGCIKFTVFHNIYWLFWMMFVVGINVITQTGDLIQVWGNLSLMTSAAFLLLSDVAMMMKVINVVMRGRVIQTVIDGMDLELRSEARAKGRKIMKECDDQTTRHLYLFLCLSGVTVLGWAGSAEHNKLPLRAWYPYDTSTSPAYELTYIQQCLSVIFAALLNVCLDTLVTSLIAVCRCRLRLLALSLTQLCQNVPLGKKNQLITTGQNTIDLRLRSCVLKHQAALRAASQIQECFSEPILTQFTASTVIICVTAYQLRIEIHQSNLVRVISMMAYLLCMMLQVFLYCLQGNQLAEESSNIAEAVYECPWYRLPLPLRRSLLLMMVRSRRVAQLTAGGIATLSLACFTSIIKVSYTFFTVLQSVED